MEDHLGMSQKKFEKNRSRTLREEATERKLFTDQLTKQRKSDCTNHGLW